MITGDGDRDPRADDYSFSARSCTSYVAQHVVFAAVVADACMVDRVIEADVHGCDAPASRGVGVSRTRRAEPRGGEGDGLPYEVRASGDVWV